MYLKPFWNENSKKALLFYENKVSKACFDTFIFYRKISKLKNVNYV